MHQQTFKLITIHRTHLTLEHPLQSRELQQLSVGEVVFLRELSQVETETLRHFLDIPQAAILH